MSQATKSRIRRVPRAEMRMRLIEAAATVFAQKGYGGASLEEVAETAGFSKGAVYSNFAGKEELFLALLDPARRCEGNRDCGRAKPR